MVMNKAGKLNQPTEDKDLVLSFLGYKDKEIIINNHSCFTNSAHSVGLSYQRESCLSAKHQEMSEKAL